MGRSLVDAQEAFDELTKQIFELKHGIVYLGANLSSRFIAEGLADEVELIDRLRAMADVAGKQCAEIGGVPERPNPILLDVANLLQKTGNPFRVIDGGPSNDDAA